MESNAEHFLRRWTFKVELEATPARLCFEALVRGVEREAPFAFAGIPLPEWPEGEQPRSLPPPHDRLKSAAIRAFVSRARRKKVGIRKRVKTVETRSPPRRTAPRPR